MPHVTHIEMVKYYRFFEVRHIGPSGRPVQTYISPTIYEARILAKAQAAANDNCRVDDKTGIAMNEEAPTPTPIFSPRRPAGWSRR